MYPTGIVYYSMWNLALKWFMEEHTRDKVVPAISLSDVQALIPDEFIPQALGGSSKYVFRCEDFSDPVYPPEAEPDSTAEGCAQDEKAPKVPVVPIAGRKWWLGCF